MRRTAQCHNKHRKQQHQNSYNANSLVSKVTEYLKTLEKYWNIYVRVSPAYLKLSPNSSLQKKNRIFPSELSVFTGKNRIAQTFPSNSTFSVNFLTFTFIVSKWINRFWCVIYQNFRHLVSSQMIHVSLVLDRRAHSYGIIGEKWRSNYASGKPVVGKINKYIFRAQRVTSH